MGKGRSHNGGLLPAEMARGASNALLVKSMAWPPSTNMWSVTPAPTSAGRAPEALPTAAAVASTRSAASPLRVSTNRRNQDPSRSVRNVRCQQATARWGV